jgi:hypothetical protein
MTMKHKQLLLILQTRMDTCMVKMIVLGFSAPCVEEQCVAPFMAGPMRKCYFRGLNLENWANANASMLCLTGKFTIS